MLPTYPTTTKALENDGNYILFLEMRKVLINKISLRSIFLNVYKMHNGELVQQKLLDATMRNLEQNAEIQSSVLFNP